MLRSLLSASLLGVLWTAFVPLSGCAGTFSIDDPLGELRDVQAQPARQIAAMDMLDEPDVEGAPHDEQYLRALHVMLWRDGYRPQVREAALERLEHLDPQGLQRTLSERLPHIKAWAWLTRLSEIIVERQWIELTPALAGSWARPTVYVQEETDRPEYRALAALHGEDRVVDVLFDMFAEKRSVAEQGLRTRLWSLLHRLGHRDRLKALVAGAEPPEDDALLIDLRAGVVELGILPRNREEILWLRRLRSPDHAVFWSEAAAVVADVDDPVRDDLELRDLPVIVAAARHDPDLLAMSRSRLYAHLEARLGGRRHHDARGGYGGFQPPPQRLYAHRESLQWGDLAAMLLALRAFQTPEMLEHLFDYAERDRQDTSTEYGGLIRLDERGRFELVEYLPRIRQHAHAFHAPPEMIDDGYTALFHFHHHAQRHRNAAHASPGHGDLEYAENTRANCLVFTFINRDTLNMDFYRHGRVIVDLGEISR